jgi:hypothetical protein
MTSKKKTPELDHPDQAVDTPLPGTSVNEEAFKALQEQYEGDPDE